MTMRSSTSRLSFPHPFILSGYPDELPAGSYDVIVEEERLDGISFVAYRRTATYIVISGHGLRAGRTEMRKITEADLVSACATAATCLEQPL
jgi:hypothetical protein